MKQCSAIPLNVKGIISEPCRSENAHEYKTFSTMNRYRTTPGLGPSKASATTTCQKCLGKGHYSYECKASLQSRPYTSRASRTQQLRNPKLKPMLAETKMSEPVADGVGDVRNAETSASDEAKGRSRSLSQERPAKRTRRSLSASSISSVSTISTEASKSDHCDARQRSSHPRDIRKRDSRSRSRSPLRERREPSVSRSRSPPRFNRRRRRRSRSRQHSRHHRGMSDEAHGSASRRTGHQRSMSPQPKASSRPTEQNRNPQTDSSQNKPYRQRSLSPFSKRLALTQAMNVGR